MIQLTIIAAFASLAALIYRTRRRRPVQPPWRVMACGVRCGACGDMMKPGTEPFSEGLHAKCK